MKNDYRNTRYCNCKNRIILDKNLLEEKIKKEHSKVKIIYNQVSQKDGQYNKEFRKIYGNKCAYCGVTTEVISSELFEIDHFICESSFNGDSISAGKMSNLVLSCKKCNRAKKDFVWDDIYSEKFNVDDESITKLFYRDIDYSIKIEDEFRKDITICGFYEKLKFKDEIRRLYFLLMNMYGFYNKYKNDKRLNGLLECILILQKKRNEF